eukprot:424869-Rhodomonas_salina.5
MELSSGFARANPDGSEARRYAVPNHETYDVLTNGWQRCGLMEEVEPPPKRRLCPVLTQALVSLLFRCGFDT